MQLSLLPAESAISALDDPSRSVNFLAFRGKWHVKGGGSIRVESSRRREPSMHVQAGDVLRSA